MSAIGDVFGAGGVSQLIQTIVNKFVPDKNVQEQVRLALEQNQTQIAQMQDDMEIKLNDIAGQNIRADAQSEDKFTQRARPFFMYIVEAILAFNYMGLPIYEMFTGKSLAPIVLPGDLLTLFGVCVTGYVFSRTAEKVAGLPGDSQINILGMKIGNKN